MKTEFCSNNLSELVLELFKLFLIPGVKEVTGLSVTINGFDNYGDVNEDQKIRQKIDNALNRNDFQTINTVANTIFPVNLWNPKLGRVKLFKRYERILPKLKKCEHNKNGIYFERMTNFKNGFNQLDKIIDIYKSGITRRSAHQVAIWDPLRDLKKVPYNKFPCLQHVVFQCVQKKLIVIGFYAIQYLVERAYGNFLGLCNLGKFMAHELKIPLIEVRCYTGVEELDINKTELKRIVSSV